MKEHIPVLDAFNGFQPSVHLSDIAIRHWDGFWFGKRETFGDVFPHHWSTATASAFEMFGDCTGNGKYRKRAHNIVDNNLCQFFAGGKASCAYLYPRRVDGRPCKFYDPYANDQDWAHLIISRSTMVKNCQNFCEIFNLKVEYDNSIALNFR